VNTILRGGLPILLVVVLMAQPVSAFDYPLSPEAIREAYFLGSGDPDKFALTLDKYTKHYPIPKSGVYIGLIEFETPYILVAERIAQNAASYHAPDAVQEFLGKPAACRVRVEVYWGYASSPAVTGRRGYPTNYVVKVKQNDKEIPVKTSWTESLIAPSSSPIDIGIAFTNEYNADKFDSDASAAVEVTAPDGTTVAETFDLGSLR
jgi:hypothetical protein